MFCGMTSTNDLAVERFADFLKRYRASPTQEALTNVTFWCGAGFSKSWDPSYPTGSELFQGSATWSSELIPTLCQNLNIDSSALDLEAVKSLVYALDMYRKYPEVRPRYFDDHLIDATVDQLVDWVQLRLASIVTSLGHWSDWDKRFPLPASLSPAQVATRRLFRALLDMGDGSKLRATGVRPHFISTNYDFVIETILNSVLAPDDFLFLYAYRGFTPTRIAGINAVPVAHDHWLALNLLKVNGGLEIRRDGAARFLLDYSPPPKGGDHVRPKLILPSREQDYLDPYCVEIFRKAVRLLRETTALVVVGYSLPEEDALLRFLLRQFSESMEDGVGKSVFYVSPQPATDRLQKVLGGRTSEYPHLYAFEGSFGDFAASVVDALPGSA
jgi:hypothetical protein